MKSIRLLSLLLAGLLLLSACAPAASPVPDGSGVAKIAAVGDIYLTDALLNDSRKMDGSYSFENLFDGIIPTISGNDLVLGNFEGCMIGSPYDSTSASHPAAFAEKLKETGIDLVQTANSYTVLHGLAGLEQTEKALNSAGLETFGTKEHKYIVKDINGIRFVFIAFTKGMNGMSLPEGAEDSVNLLYSDYDSNYAKVNTSRIIDALEAAKQEQPDVLIAALHWGSENNPDLSSTQETIADLLFDHGVDVILGTHSHLMQRLEEREITTRDGKEKNVLLAYGLGDFCATREDDYNLGMVLRMEFTMNEDGTVSRTQRWSTAMTLDQGTAEYRRFAVLNAEDALSLYENNYYQSISEEVYEDLLKEMDSVREIVEGTEEE